MGLLVYVCSAVIVAAPAGLTQTRGCRRGRELGPKGIESCKCCVRADSLVRGSVA